MFVARLKPYDPRKGQVVRSYGHRGLGKRFVEGLLYEGLTQAEADTLRVLKQPPAGKGPLFDVGTPEEMADILANEAAGKLGVSRVIAPKVVPPPKMAAQPVPPVAPSEPLPEETVEADMGHTDIRSPAGNVRVRHTQDAPEPPVPEPITHATSARPKKRSGR